MTSGDIPELLRYRLEAAFAGRVKLDATERNIMLSTLACNEVVNVVKKKRNESSKSTYVCTGTTVNCLSGDYRWTNSHVCLVTFFTYASLPDVCRPIYRIILANQLGFV